MIMFPGGWGES